ncbi:MAG: bifunctional folylpolyglutamate synthase/dihydrofolate synthase [Deltaproteobacteria bacterium]|nr:bifunctional folylpolyglutamate synthase/dihydrofolate synthase [Deltaproteobacteria bacterium]
MDLDAVRKILKVLGNPERDYPSILIAGTNGKGSVAAMTASILSAGGFSVGLYTSPHLTDIRERIRIGNMMITEREFGKTMRDVDDHLTEPLTYFELMTVLAFHHFRQKKIDVAVVEVGMGGRFDATHVVDPSVAVISHIALDHQEYLGKRLKDIAGEKSAIIPKRGICITGVRQLSARQVIVDTCREREATLLRIGGQIQVYRHRDGAFSYRSPAHAYPRLHCGLVGAHQQINAALAVASVEAMAVKGFTVNEASVREGLGNVRWEGRLEVLQRAPVLLLDGAHNPAGIGSLCHALRNKFSFRRLIVLFGVLRDKHYPDMIRRLSVFQPLMILTQPPSERSMPPAELLPIARAFLQRAEIIQSPVDALKYALSLADEDDLICVTGSLYLVGEIKKTFPSMRTMIAAEGK